MKSYQQPEIPPEQTRPISSSPPRAPHTQRYEPSQQCYQGVECTETAENDSHGSLVGHFVSMPNFGHVDKFVPAGHLSVHQFHLNAALALD